MIQHMRPVKWTPFFTGFVFLLLMNSATAWPGSPGYSNPYYRPFMPRYPARPQGQYPYYYQPVLPYQRQLIEQMKRARQAQLKVHKQHLRQMMEMQQRHHEMQLQQQKESSRIHQQFLRQFRQQKQEWLEAEKKRSREQNKSGQKYFRQFFDDQRA